MKKGKSSVPFFLLVLAPPLFTLATSDQQAPPALRDADLRTTFKVFDANDDGFLTPKELRVALAALAGVPGPAQQFEAHSFVQLGDRNHDGALDAKEFALALRAKSETGTAGASALTAGASSSYRMASNRPGETTSSGSETDRHGGPQSLVGRTVISPFGHGSEAGMPFGLSCTAGCKANPAMHDLSEEACTEYCGKVSKLNAMHQW